MCSHSNSSMLIHPARGRCRTCLTEISTARNGAPKRADLTSGRCVHILTIIPNHILKFTAYLGPESRRCVWSSASPTTTVTWAFNMTLSATAVTNTVTMEGRTALAVGPKEAYAPWVCPARPHTMVLIFALSPVCVRFCEQRGTLRWCECGLGPARACTTARLPCDWWWHVLHLLCVSWWVKLGHYGSLLRLVGRALGKGRERRT